MSMIAAAENTETKAEKYNMEISVLALGPIHLIAVYEVAAPQTPVSCKMTAKKRAGPPIDGELPKMKVG
jgi:hypothetical protein